MSGQANLRVPDEFRAMVRKFARNYVTVHVVPDGEAAWQLIEPHLTDGVTVASGNSLTLRQTGIFDHLASGGHPARFVNQFEPGLSFAENRRLKKAGLSADVYISSANAVTEDGKICCLDGGGNRVAAIMFGPDRVFIVAGRNKIAPDEAAAWQRIRDVVAPQTGIYLKRTLPCTKDGKCHDCGEPERFCRYYITVNGQMERDRDRITLIIVDQDLGL